MENLRFTQKWQIRLAVINWFNMFSNGERFTTDDVVKYVNKWIKKKAEPGTIKRELRRMRLEKRINYKTVGLLNEKVIEVIK